MEKTDAGKFKTLVHLFINRKSDLRDNALIYVSLSEPF